MSISGWLPSFFTLSENASSYQTAGADPDHPDSTDPGRGARDDPERVCRYPLIFQRGRQYIPLQKCGKATLYAHVGLPSTFWAGMFADALVEMNESETAAKTFIVFFVCMLCDTMSCFSAGVPEADRIPEIHWQTNRLFGSYAAVRWEAGCSPTNDKLH